MVDTNNCQENEPFALQVTDDSMEPEFKQGCIIIIDPTASASDGAYVFAEHGDGYIFRELSFIDAHPTLIALNEAYPPIPLKEGLNTIKGVIVQRAGTRRRYFKRY